MMSAALQPPDPTLEHEAAIAADSSLRRTLADGWRRAAADWGEAVARHPGGVLEALHLALVTAYAARAGELEG